MTGRKHIAIIGGGAAGFFAAITAAEADPGARVTIYERGKHYLAKVKVSGGGRCNVTHSCFDPAALATHYPRGSRELRAAFHRWQPRDTIEWFAARGVTLKTESDGRMFPDTNHSQTIVDCFMDAASSAGVDLRNGLGVTRLGIETSGKVRLELSDDTTEHADAVCVAVGSLKASPLSGSLETLGHTIQPLAPSLFAFNISDKRIHGLSGLSVENTSVRVLPKSQPRIGPLLITHRGFSGPAVLRLSAWEARSLKDQNYHVEIEVNWLGQTSEGQLRERFRALRRSSGKSAVSAKVFDELPRRLWKRMVEAAGIGEALPWAELTKQLETALVAQLLSARFRVQGKTTNKDEFVTCGGVRLDEVDFRTMESRKVPGLYFAGECLDIDGITGGFNFQAAWTGGHLAGVAMAG